MPDHTPPPSNEETEIPESSGVDSIVRAVAAAPPVVPLGADFRAGEIIEETFEIGGMLGRGGMGVVYEARDLKLDRRVAIKLHRRGDSETAIARMLREAQTMARVRHPNVVNVHAVGTHAGRLYIAIEYVGGGTLRDWLTRAPRSIAAILDLFDAAGEGLAAAHRAGLVHRDFKPDNVLMDEDDRPRVADFGIARAAVSPPDEGVSTAPEAATGSPERPSADQGVSLFGPVVGTLIYAAPEQIRGDRVDARSDQYSFCAALYEALHGRLPFEAEPIAGLESRIEAQRLAPVEPARAREVPRAVRRVILRGLSFDPADRHADMEALLAALRRARRLPRRLASAGLMLGAAGAVTWGATRGPDASMLSACEDADVQLAGIWDPARENTLRAALLPVPNEARGREFDAAVARIDRFVSRWKTQWKQSCGSTSGRQCMVSARGRLHGLLQFFEQVGPEVLTYAAQALAQLPDPMACAAKSEDASVAEDPERRALAEQLSDARLRYLARPAAADHAELTSIAQQAEAAGYLALASEALSLAGERIDDEDRPREAEPLLRRAAQLALASGERSMMVYAWSLLAANLASQSRLEEAREKLELARGSAFDIEDPRVLGALANNEGIVLGRLGKSEEAIASFERAIELNTKAYGPEHSIVASSRRGLATRLLDAGRPADARAEYETALLVLRHSVGEEHPSHAMTLAALGFLCATTGDFECAEPALQRALSVHEKVFGPEGAPTLTILDGLAELRRQQGRHAEALSIYQKVYDLATANGHEPSPTLARAAGNIAVGRASAGDFEAALPYAIASREAFAASLGEQHPELVQADNILGIIHRELGDLDASLDALARAHALAKQVLGTTHRERVNTTIELGATHLARGEPDRAVALAQDALVVLSDPPGNPLVVAEARFLLARALGRSSGRAQTLAREALGTYASAGRGYAPQAGQIRGWLASQP